MAIANQGYRRDLNLSETENEEEAISNLMGTGIDDDLRYLQNNLRNTSRIAFWYFFEYPDEIPLYGIVIETWWINKDKQ